MLVDKQNDLMSDLLFTVHQHGGDDVKKKTAYKTAYKPGLEPGLRARTRRRTRQFFAFPPFSRPASPMTIKRTVFVAIMEGKHELGLGLG